MNGWIACMALQEFTSVMTKLKVYTDYILKRFHLIPLFILVLSDILVVHRVLDDGYSPLWKYASALAFVLLYLFSNRLGDDLRDFEFDQKHYPDRAVQKGLLSKAELNIMLYISYALMSIIAFVLNVETIIAFAALLLISVLAKRDFFLPESFKTKYYFSYNFLNMLQMLALQIFVYLLLGVEDFDQLILIHILLVFTLSLQTEVTRKVKAEKHVSMDNYSDRLGMKGALFLWLLFAVLSALTAAMMADMLGVDLVLLVLLEVLFVSICTFGAVYYYKKKSDSAENLFWLCFILFYIAQNLMITYA